MRIEIAGHTDDRSDPAENQLLSQKRAQAVVVYLTKAGIEPGRMQAIGYGKARPALPNISDENRQIKWRIEWRVL